MEKVITLNLSYVIGKKIFSDDGFQNMFVYQPTFHVLYVKDDKSTEHVIAWKSKGLYASKLIRLYCFLR